MKIKALNSLWLLMVALVVVGCGGGGSSSDAEPAPRPSGEVSGVAFDGLIMGGDVRVYAWDGVKRDELGRGRTDNDGLYSISLDQVPSQPILIEVTNGRYIEEASGLNVQLREGDVLYALYDYKEGEDVTTSLTYFTTLATGLAEFMVRTGSPVKEAISKSNTAISNLINVDIRSVKPLEITDDENATPTITDSHLYGFSTAAISQLTLWISERNNQTAHRPYNSIRFAQAAYNDIRANGRLDGNGVDGIVALGTVALNQEIYRHRHAINMLVIANRDINATGLAASDLLDHANSYNESNASIFGSADITPLSDQSPTISNIIPNEGSVVAGNLEVRFSAIDVIGVSEVGLYINGQLAEKSSAVSFPHTFSIDTQTLSDGHVELEIVAKNLAGGESKEVVNIQVSNAGTTINNMNPPDGSYVTGSHTFTAEVSDPIGIESVHFVLNDAATFQPGCGNSNPCLDFNLANMNEGENTWMVRAVNSVGHEVTESASFTIDNTPPVIDWGLADGSYLEGTEYISATITDNIGLQHATLYLNGEVLADYSSFPNIEYYLNTKEHFEGRHTLVLEAVDKAGNITTEEREVYFDNTPPSVNIISPASGETITSSFNIVVDIFDAVDIKEVEYKINGTHLAYGKEESGRQNVWVNLNNYSNGSHVISVTATDGSGKKTEKSTHVNFRHEAPRFSIFRNETTTSNGLMIYALGIDITNSFPDANYKIERWTIDGNDKVFPHEISNSGRITHSILLRYEVLGNREHCPGRVTGRGRLTVSDNYGNSSTLTVPNASGCTRPLN